MGVAHTPTLLALDRYAQIMGFNPAHFNQTAGSSVMPVTGTCNNIWFQHEWQNGERVSREQIARAISDAEFEIARYVGYWPAPKWVDKEMHRYQHHHRPDVIAHSGRQPNLYLKGVKTHFGKFIMAGQRAATLIGTASTGGGTLVFSDEDGDSFNETATITLATTVTDIRDVHAFYPGKSAAEEWEIRPPKSISISGGTLTMTFYIWQLVDENLLEQLTTDSALNAVNLEVEANFLDSIDVYFIYTDFTQESAQFFWENLELQFGSFAVCGSCSGSGCVKCALAVQDGCIHIRDVELGIVAASPASYDASVGAWLEIAAAECREPDILKIWYYAGDMDNAYLRGDKWDPLSQYWAETIAWLATARLDMPICSCGPGKHKSDALQKDITLAFGNERYINTFDRIDNPFGTRIGEVRAWKRVEQFARHVPRVAVI